MDEQLLLNVGLETPLGSYHQYSGTMFIEVKNEIIIHEFTIDLNFTGNMTITFQNTKTGEIKNKEVTVLNTGLNILTIDIELSPGFYKIYRDNASVNLLKRTNYDVLFPFYTKDIVLIGGNSDINLSNRNWYYYWFNIKYYRKKVLHYDFQECGEPTENLVTNPNLSNIVDVNNLWDESLNGTKALLTWSSGYNSGVDSPEIGYHLHVLKEGKFGDWCFKFIDKNSQFDVLLKHRWLGISKRIADNVSNLGWGDGTEVTISFDVKVDDVRKGVRLGLYHRNADNTLNTFDGLINKTFYLDKLNTWQRISYTGTLDLTKWDLNEYCNLYIYGNQNIDDYEGIAWVDNIQIETKDHLTDFVIGTRQGKVLDKSGYNFHLTVLELTSPIWQKSVINNYLYKFNNKPLDGQTFQHFKTNLFIPKTFSFGLWIRGSTLEQPLDNIYPFGWQNLCTMGPSGGTNDNRSGIIYYYDTSNYTSWNPGSRNLYNGKWHHWFITYDGNTGLLKQYIDGLLDLETIRTNLYHLETVRPFNVGSLWATNYGGHGGNITDVRVYLTLLTDLEIEKIYNKSKKNKLEEKNNVNNIKKSVINNLVLYYKFDKFVESTENLISNPGFDNGFNDWTKDANVSVETITFQNKKCLKMTRVDGSSSYDGIQNPNDISIKPNTEYTQQIRVYLEKLVTKNIRYYMTEYDSLNNRVSFRHYINITPADPIDEWITKTYTFTSSLDLTKLSGIYFDWTNELCTQNDEYIIIDYFQLEEKLYLTPYTPNIRNGYIKDYSGNNNYGKLFLGTSPKYIELEKLYEFGNGDISNIKIEVPEIVIPKELITVNLWLYQTDNGSNDNPLITYSDSTSFLTGFLLWNGYGTDMRWTVNGNQILKVINNMYNSWHMYTGTYDSITGDSKFYYDGILQDSINLGLNVLITNSTRNLTIGNQLRNSNQSFSGKIKDVRIYNKLLSLNLIKQLYNQTK